MKKAIFVIAIALFVIPFFCHAKIVNDIKISEDEVIYYTQTTPVQKPESVIDDKNSLYSFIEKIDDQHFRIFSDPKFFYDEEMGEWYNLKMATTTPKDLEFMYELQEFDKITFFDSLKIYPVYAAPTFPANIGYGEIYYNTSNNWVTTHDATVGSNHIHTIFGAYSGYRATPVYIIYRGFISFNLGTIDWSQISAATLNGVVVAAQDVDNDGHDFLLLVDSTQSATTTITNNDYDNIGSTALTDSLDVTGWAVAQDKTFTFTAAGVNYLKSTSTPRMAIREGHDYDNHAVAASVNDTGAEFQNVYLEVTIPSASSTPPATGTSTTEIDWGSDLSKVVVWTFDYDGTNTSATSTIHKTVYDIPFVNWIIIIVPFYFVAYILLGTLLEMWQKK